jgi:hypothetical protein
VFAGAALNRDKFRKTYFFITEKSNPLLAAQNIKTATRIGIAVFVDV